MLCLYDVCEAFLCIFITKSSNVGYLQSNRIFASYSEILVILCMKYFSTGFHYDLCFKLLDGISLLSSLDLQYDQGITISFSVMVGIVPTSLTDHCDKFYEAIK